MAKEKIVSKAIFSGLLKAAPVIFLICFILISYYLFNKYQFRLKVILELPLRVFLVLIGLVLVNFIFSGLITERLVRIFGVKLSFMEWYGLRVINNYINYLPFKGGAVAKGLYLKKRHGLSISHFVSLTGGSILLVLLSYGVLGLAVWLLSWDFGADISIIFPLAFVSFVVLGVIFLFYSPGSSNRKGWIFDRLNGFYQGWKLIRTDRRIVGTVIVLSVVLSLTYALRLLILFRWQGAEITFSQALLIYLLTSAGMFVNITPASLGVKEALLIFSSSLIGADMEVCVYVTALDRLVPFAVIFLLGPLFSCLLGKKAGLTSFLRPEIDTPKN